MPQNTMRDVTERDFRLPEFRDAKVEDYEFRADGAVVRKDRWMTAIYKIADLVGLDRNHFEIGDVVDRVKFLVDLAQVDLTHLTHLTHIADGAAPIEGDGGQTSSGRAAAGEAELTAEAKRLGLI